ncbi:mannose-6-phosphate isomerase, class I [Klugiella xanthotipulae]
MFVQIANVPRDYAWGSTTAIPELLGTAPTGRPQAELWLGTHPGSPSTVVLPDGSTGDLGQWLESVGATPQLPYLLKVLAAERPLSLQVHPSMVQARAGFERENALGIPRDAPHRNYRDAQHKPEVVVALSDAFHALSGFRALAEVQDDLAALAAVTTLSEDDLAALSRFAVRCTVSMHAPTEEAVRRELLDWVFSASPEAVRAGVALERAAAGLVGAASPSVATLRDLAGRYPGDPGTIVSLLLNRITLARGEAVYLPAGNIHAYLHGVGIEVMAASDNVLRGGLTPKHVDTAELFAVLDYATLPSPLLAAETLGEGVARWSPDVPDFQVWRLSPSANSPIPAPWRGVALGIVTEGEITLTEGDQRQTFRAGQSCAVCAEPGRVLVSGTGVIFAATVGD